MTCTKDESNTFKGIYLFTSVLNPLLPIIEDDSSFFFLLSKEALYLPSPCWFLFSWFSLSFDSSFSGEALESLSLNFFKFALNCSIFLIVSSILSSLILVTFSKPTVIDLFVKWIKTKKETQINIMKIVYMHNVISIGFFLSELYLDKIFGSVNSFSNWLGNIKSYPFSIIKWVIYWKYS